MPRNRKEVSHILSAKIPAPAFWRRPGLWIISDFYSAFLPALFALAQRAFMRIEILLLPASLIWPRLRGPAEEVETRRVRPPVRASIAAMTLSRCSVSASMMLGVSICSGIIKQLGFKEHDSKSLSETQSFRLEGMSGS